MAEQVLVNSKLNTLADTIESFYQAVLAGNGGNGTRVIAFTASNNGSASASYKAYIYDSSGALLQAVVPQKIVVRDRFDLAPSIISQLIPPGGTLRMESSTANSIVFRVTGREL